jgi:Fe2+ or Zn2+ uptake regulation protein
MKNNFVNFASDKLKLNGLKITSPRKMVLEFLAVQDKAMTPYEIRKMLAGSGKKADVVTLYRILDEFENIGLVHKVVTLGRYVRCDEHGEVNNHEHTANNDCHHYLICSSCQKVEEVSGEDLRSLEKKISKITGFQIKSHTLEFLGLCKSCQ